MLDLSVLRKSQNSLRLPGFIVEILRNEPLEDLDGVSQCEEATDRLSDIVQRKFEEGDTRHVIPATQCIYDGLQNRCLEHASCQRADRLIQRIRQPICNTAA